MRTFRTWLLLLTVVAAPFPGGSNWEWAWMLEAVAVAVCLLSLAASLRARRSAGETTPVGLLVPLLAIGVIVWSLIQAYGPFPNEFVASLTSTGFAHLTARVDSHIAVDQEAAMSGTIRLMTYASIFYLSAQACRSAVEAHRLCVGITTAGVVVSILGFAKDVWIDQPLAGTFVNPDNCATFLGLAALVSLLNIAGKIQQSDDHSLNARARWRLRIAVFSGTAAIWGAGFLILLAGIFYSRSKGGVLSILIAAPLSVMILMVLKQRSRSAIFFAAMAMLVIVITVFGIAGQRMLYKWERLLSYGDLDRSLLYSTVLQIISARPITGWGLDSLASLYPVFQSNTAALYYDRAHNSYLEAALEFGLPGALAFFLTIGFIGLRCFVGISVRVRNSHFACLAFSSTIFMALHSLVDFGAQIPAVSITYSALLGLGLAQSRSSRCP